MRADDRAVCGMKALDKRQRLLALAREGTAAGSVGQEIAEGFIRLPEIDAAKHAIQVMKKIAALTQATVVRVPVLAIDVNGLQLCRVRNRHGLCSGPVQELGTQLDG